MPSRTLTVALGAAALIATPLVARAADSPWRLAAPVTESDNVGGASAVIIALLAVAAIVGGIVIAADDDETPTSP